MDEEAKVEAPQEPTHQWSPFESLMIQKMNVMLHLHQKHLADIHSTIENITTQLENIETRVTLSTLLNPDEMKLSVATCPSRASEGEAHGCAFQRRKDARSRHQRLFVGNVGKTEGNRSK